jgi:hypothetical protein
MMRRLVPALAASALLAVGIAEAHKVDPASAATFRFIKGYGHAKLLGGSSHMFTVQPDITSCHHMHYITGMKWSEGPEKEMPVPAGAPINLFAQTDIKTDGGPYTAVSNICSASVTFTPKVGGHYSVIHHAEWPTPCTLEVLDDATGAPPPDLVENPAIVCRGYQ